MCRKSAAAVVIALMAVYQIATAAQLRPGAGSKRSDGLLLIVSMNESKVDIIDESSLKTVASLKTGKGPHEVRVAPDGRNAYAWPAGRFRDA